jgi:hypothetical protein
LERDPDGLDDVSVVLNPAGFVYLRYVLSHFEFLSVLAGNKRPLFSVDVEPATGDGKAEYLFEEIVARTLRVTKQRIADMGTFYRDNVIKKLEWEGQQYLQSRFAFKHAGQKGRREQGTFHAFRLVTSHVDYVDAFRLQLLRRHRDQPALVPKLNRALISFIEKYTAALDAYPEFRTDDLLDEFRDRIRKVRDSGFTDTELRIESH